MQNVNLYLPELRPKRQWLAASGVLSLSLGITLLLAILTVVASVNIADYKKSVIALEQKVSIVEENVKKIKSKNLGNSASAIDREIKQLRRAIAKKNHIATVIGSKDLGNNQGYSERLKDLARASNKKISLQQFRFSLGGKKVEVMGQTTQTTAVTDFVDELKSRPSFESATFSALTLSDNTGRTNTFDFAFGYNPLFDHQLKVSESQ